MDLYFGGFLSLESPSVTRANIERKKEHSGSREGYSRFGMASEGDDVIRKAINIALIKFVAKGYILVVLGLSFNVLWVYLLQVSRSNIEYKP